MKNVRTKIGKLKIHLTEIKQTSNYEYNFDFFLICN